MQNTPQQMDSIPPRPPYLSNVFKNAVQLNYFVFNNKFFVIMIFIETIQMKFV